MVVIGERLDSQQTGRLGGSPLLTETRTRPYVGGKAHQGCRHFFLARGRGVTLTQVPRALYLDNG